MIDLTGYNKINGTDIWTACQAFLCEISKEATLNQNELLKMPKMKSYTSVDFRERNGEDLPETLDPKYEAIDRSLQFCVFGDTMPAAIANYNSLINLLKSGWLLFEILNISNCKMYYQEQSDPTWYDDPVNPGCVFKAKFREPKPGEVEY